jgi:predicted transcriptional regulator
MNGQQQKKQIKKRKPPRFKIQIYGDLLRILDREASSGKILLTRIQVKIDVPFDRLKKYVSELQGLALVENEKTLKVTKKGKQYIQEYDNIIQAIENMSQIITALSPETPKKPS